MSLSEAYQSPIHIIKLPRYAKSLACSTVITRYFSSVIFSHCTRASQLWCQVDTGSYSVSSAPAQHSPSTTCVCAASLHTLLRTCTSVPVYDRLCAALTLATEEAGKTTHGLMAFRQHKHWWFTSVKFGEVQNSKQVI